MLGRFPQQAPLEIDREILRFAALQLGADAETIHAYERRQQTVSEHQQRIGEYLRLRTFDTRRRRTAGAVPQRRSAAARPAGVRVVCRRGRDRRRGADSSRITGPAPAP